jgi:hypothetical protein
MISLECLKALFEHMPDAEKKCPLCWIQWAEVAMPENERIQTDITENPSAALAAYRAGLERRRANQAARHVSSRLLDTLFPSDEELLQSHERFLQSQRELLQSDGELLYQPATPSPTVVPRPAATSRPATPSHHAASTRHTVPTFRPLVSSRHAVPTPQHVPSRHTCGPQSLFNPLPFAGIPRPVPTPGIPDIMPFPAHAFSQSSHGWEAGRSRVADSRASRGSAHGAVDQEFMHHFFGVEEREARDAHDDAGDNRTWCDDRSPRDDHTPRGDRHAHGGRR